jgi:hypothetical protein
LPKVRGKNFVGESRPSSGLYFQGYISLATVTTFFVFFLYPPLLYFNLDLARHFKPEPIETVAFSFGISENTVFSNAIDSGPCHVSGNFLPFMQVKVSFTLQPSRRSAVFLLG